MRDYSEYKADKHDYEDLEAKYSKYLRFFYFTNHVHFIPNTARLHIRVDSSYEWPSIKEVYNEYEEQMGRKITGASLLAEMSEEDRAEAEEQGAFEDHEKAYAAFQEKFNISMDEVIEQFSYFYKEHGIPFEAPNNLLAGAHIRYQIGEGLLDFMYADFETPFRLQYRINEALHMFGKEDIDAEFPDELSQEDIDAISAAGEQEKAPQKIYNELQDIAETYDDYVMTMIMSRELLYASLYTTICPPVFFGGALENKPIVIYYNYLRALQERLLRLVEFCFDQDFYPDVFRNVLPSERYYIYCRVHDKPFVNTRLEDFTMSSKQMQGDSMPFGMSKDEIIQRITQDIPITDQHKAFAEAHGIETDDLVAMLKIPHFINVYDRFGSVQDIIDLEFTKMLEHDFRFRKCRRCGKYFIMKGNYDTNYCTRIAEGETRTCQELAAQENYRHKTENQKELRVYMKYYKRYAARVRVGLITEDAFKQWKYSAMTKRDKCTAGKITLQAFTEWLESSFPNRKKK